MDGRPTRKASERTYLYVLALHASPLREPDAGLRLHHLLLSPSLAARLEEADVDRMARGRDGASDHAPAWITLSKMRR
jgi:exonuclease III